MFTPEDNTMSKVIVYSDDEYGHDDEAVSRWRDVPKGV